jgi:hypothetical protein
MPRVEEVCLEAIPIDIENMYHCVCDIDNNSQVEDVFNQILDTIYECDCNFWDCEYGYDEIVEEDLTMLASYGNNMDLMLKNYYKHMMVQQKESICATIQEKLNRR